MLYEYYPDGIRGVKTADSVPTVYLVNSGYVVAEYRESGTYYLRARYYNPGTGRFTQEDPHWNPGI